MTWKCNNCKTESDDTVEVCWKCGYNKTEISTKTVERGDVPVPNKKYPALLTISKIMNILGWVIAAIGVIISVYIFRHDGPGGIVTAILILIGTVFLTLSFLAYSELIKLLIDMERNTRNSSN